MKEERKEGKERRIVAEGVSRKIRRDLEDVIESLDIDAKHKGERLKQEYKKICGQITVIAQATNRCYGLWINDSIPLINNSSRNPLILLNYARLFMEGLVTMREEQIRQKKERQKQNQGSISLYNSNNVYELIAKRNIEIVQMEGRINDLRIQRQISQKKALIAQQMTEAVRSQSEELLKAYRQNFSKMTELLKCAQAKETQILQANRLLSQRIETINREYQNYKANFKMKPSTGQGEKRLRQRLQRQYEQRLKQQLRQRQMQLKNIPKAK